MIKFRMYDKSPVKVSNKDFDFYTVLSQELQLERYVAKELYWKVIFGASDTSLGATAAKIDSAGVKEEEKQLYATLGRSLRPIISHYVIERMHILHNLDQINYDIPIDE